MHGFSANSNGECNSTGGPSDRAARSHANRDPVPARICAAPQRTRLPVSPNNLPPAKHGAAPRPHHLDLVASRSQGRHSLRRHPLLDRNRRRLHRTRHCPWHCRPPRRNAKPRSIQGLLGVHAELKEVREQLKVPLGLHEPTHAAEVVQQPAVRATRRRAGT